MSDAAADPLSQVAVDEAERTFRRRILAALAAAAVSLLVMVAVSLLLYQRGVSSNAWVEHTYAAESKISALATDIERLETSRRGYLLSPRDTLWRVYVETRGALRPAAADLAEFTSDNPVQARNSARLSDLLEQKLQQMRSSIELAHDGDLEKARDNFTHDQTLRLTSQLRAVIAAMLGEERRLLASRTDTVAANGRWLLLTVVMTAALLAAIATGVMVLMRRFAEELTRSQAALRSLNVGLEDAVRDRTADLQRANDEIQRFAYIVSHDLRSPLVNVMGFTSELEQSMKPIGALLEAAETAAPSLVPTGARMAVRDDVPEAIGFIRSSTQKMDRLINAILQLSRQGRRSLTPEPLDMAALAQGVADSLETLARAKEAQVAVEGRLPALTSDRLAVEQVLSNLMENALKYLQPGRPGRVAVRGASVPGGRVALEVEDNGRGIDPRDHERVFELFRRSGAQDTPGEGIGLAHVRALVYRLGGTIACTSELGRGSVFKVTLPAKSAREEGTPAA